MHALCYEDEIKLSLEFSYTHPYTIPPPAIPMHGIYFNKYIRVEWKNIEHCLSYSYDDDDDNGCVKNI